MNTLKKPLPARLAYTLTYPPFLVVFFPRAGCVEVEVELEVELKGGGWRGEVQ